jgi:integrase
MPSTLSNDLRSIGLLYAWANGALEQALDDLLENGHPLSGMQIQDLLAFLRVGGRVVDVEPAMIVEGQTVARHASVIRDFLKWAVDPAGQGRPSMVSFEQIGYRRACLDEAFQAATRHSGASRRLRPLTAEEVTRVDELIGPVRKADGSLMLPLRFARTNPFRTETRLRNWLMYGIAIQCGLRRGELLKLRLDDLPRPDTPWLVVRRRAHDAADARRHRPAVKTVERVLDLSGELRAGLRAYLTNRTPSGRSAGRTPYLVGVIARNARIHDLSILQS